MNIFYPACAGASLRWHEKCPRCGATRHDDCLSDAAYNAQLARRNKEAANIEIPVSDVNDLDAVVHDLKPADDMYLVWEARECADAMEAFHIASAAAKQQR